MPGDPDRIPWSKVYKSGGGSKVTTPWKVIHPFIPELTEIVRSRPFHGIGGRRRRRFGGIYRKFRVISRRKYRY